MLANKGGQAIDTCICADIEYDCCFLCKCHPAIYDFFFDKVSSKEKYLPLQHFSYIALHLKATISQLGDAMRTSSPRRSRPQSINHAQFPSPHRKPPGIANQHHFKHFADCQLLVR